MAAAWIRPAGEQGPPPGHLRGEDLGLVSEAIRGILTGRLGEAERKNLHEMLAEQVRYSDSITPPDCRHCADVGLRFVNEGGCEVTYRCSCSRGLSDPRAFPTYRGGP